MLGELVPCGGGESIPLLKSKLVVGRQDICDIALRYPTVSSRHCELEFRDGYWYVKDLGSSNGIRVNGVSCESKVLMPNDILWVARYRFNVVYTLKADRPPQQSDTPAAGIQGSLLAKAGFVTGDAVDDGTSQNSEASDSSLGVLTPVGGGDPIPLLKPRVVVGRQGNCDIRLREPSISSRHCELELNNGYWYVRDLGSSNGIRVDGVKCESKCLMPGSVLWIAKLRYRITYTAKGAAPSSGAAPLSFTRGLLERAGLVRRKPDDETRKPRKPDARDTLPDVPEDDDDKRKRWSVDEE
jgi:pSer/pThr/pTyr-binding forkhead associated (FHA) protein